MTKRDENESGRVARELPTLGGHEPEPPELQKHVEAQAAEQNSAYDQSHE